MNAGILDRRTGKFDDSIGGAGNTSDYIKERCLTGTIGAGDTKGLTFEDIKVDTIYCCEPAVSFDDAASSQQW